ncbi:MAG: FtsX-like permease family protein [Hyphomonadaceae bacterium]|nr:FtsX-like permease family protein [Hyphomonadaceae bacterium]
MEASSDNLKGAPPFGRFERKIAARYLGARKSEGGVGLIAVLSFLCITLAIFAMITIMSIMNGFREKMVELTLGADGHMYVGSASANPTPQDMENLRLKIANIDGVENAFLFNQTVTGIVSEPFTPGIVTGIGKEDLSALKMISDNIVVGDLEAFGRGKNGGNQIAIGIQMANRLGKTVGDGLTLISPVRTPTAFGPGTPRTKNYQIGAIFEVGLFTADSGYVYMPIDQASLFFERGKPASDIQIRLDNPDQIHATKPKIRDVAGQPVFIETWEDKNLSTATALRTEQIAMRFIFMIVVVISVFPILAAMIMLVKNKGKDIAILRTIGATSGSILRTFLMSGAAIGMLGTLAGVILGLLFCWNIGFIQSIIEAITGAELFPPEVYGLNQLPVKIVPMEVAQVAFWGFLVSALATFFPAWTASKTDPVEALRYE